MKANLRIAFKVIFTLVLLQSAHTFSQTEKEAQDIIKNYDLKKIKKLEEYHTKKAAAEKQEALEAAKKNNWPEFRFGTDGSVSELMKLTPDGFPVYFSQDNVNAAKSTRANILQNTYNVKGEGMVGRIWDGGKVRASHQEFGGRVTVVDDTAGPAGNNFHATHVTGTVIASGVQANAKGMAPMAQARTFNWTNDIAEALSEVQLGMLLSNHSYGVPSNTGVPSWYIGAYTDESKSWDEVAYASPYYLQVVSAGNNGTDANSNPSSIGYDKLTGNKVSKNNLVVANAQDAIVSNNGTLVSVAINAGSSQGPSDDLRIKPDITGNGTELYSTLETTNTSYGSLTGTSMSSPNVMGTLLLVQQLYKNVNFHFMKAATLKALACHTADDAGAIGPDAKFGWGLLNGKKAAETIASNGLNSIISEETLEQGQTYSFTVESNGTAPLMASIVWTDVPGQTTSVLNNTTPRLVNDLDLRITKGTATYFPWKLQSNANLVALKTMDNSVDTVERVEVPSASGTYTITVTHKGTLVNGPQDFSIIVTGANSSFSITPTSADKVVCSNESVVYTFDYKTTNGNTTPTTFSVEGAPTGATVDLSSNSLSANGQITMTISNLQNVAAGNYIIGLKGTSATETETTTVKLRVFQPNFSDVTKVFPANNQEGISTTVDLKWLEDVNANGYTVQLSTDATFANPIVNATTTETHYLVKNLNQANVYYWRVLPANLCGQATSNGYSKFDTGMQTCSTQFSAADFSNATIATVENSTGFVPVNVTGGLTVGELSVNLNLTHEYIGDIAVYLEGPAAIGSPIVMLFEEPCGDFENINATISDNGTAFTCASNPAITGIVLPEQPLSAFNNLPADGQWILRVVDFYDNDGGTINGVTLNFCSVVSANLSTEEELAAKVSAYPNPTKGILNVQLPNDISNATLSLFDIQGRKIMSKNATSASEVMQLGNLQEGVYILSVEDEKFRTTKKIVLSK